jgi:hypothetical protein
VLHPKTLFTKSPGATRSSSPSPSHQSKPRGAQKYFSEFACGKFDNFRIYCLIFIVRKVFVIFLRSSFLLPSLPPSLLPPFPLFPPSLPSLLIKNLFFQESNFLLRNKFNDAIQHGRGDRSFDNSDPRSRGHEHNFNFYET